MENFSGKIKVFNRPFRVAGGIIFENEKFVAVNKPSGLLTIPDRHDEMLNSLYKTLQQQYEKIFIVFHVPYFMFCQLSYSKVLLLSFF